MGIADDIVDRQTWLPLPPVLEGEHPDPERQRRWERKGWVAGSWHEMAWEIASRISTVPIAACEYRRYFGDPASLPLPFLNGVTLLPQFQFEVRGFEGLARVEELEESASEGTEDAYLEIVDFLLRAPREDVARFLKDTRADQRAVWQSYHCPAAATIKSAILMEAELVRAHLKTESVTSGAEEAERKANSSARAKIPANERTVPMSYRRAAQLMGKGNSQDAAEWLAKSVRDGNIPCEHVTRQTHVFSKSNFPKTVWPQILPPPLNPSQPNST
jgi:hypothetical protein